MACKKNNILILREKMNSYVISENYTLREVMECFEENHERVVLVENDREKLVGTISQGDIIRALLAGVNLYAPIKQIMKPSFLYLKERDYKKAYAIFKSKKVTLIPIIDEEAKLISIITLEDIFQYLEGTVNA